MASSSTHTGIYASAVAEYYYITSKMKKSLICILLLLLFSQLTACFLAESLILPGQNLGAICFERLRRRKDSWSKLQNALFHSHQRVVALADVVMLSRSDVTGPVRFPPGVCPDVSLGGARGQQQGKVRKSEKPPS